MCIASRNQQVFFGQHVVAKWVALAGLCLFTAGAQVSPDAPRKVRVGIYENKPKVFTEPETQKPSGIFVDILEHIAEQEGWVLEYVPGSWSDGLARLEAGEIDLMPDVAYSVERAGRFDFHNNLVVVSWSQFYARRGLKLERWTDLDGRRVAVLEGSIQQSTLSQMTRGLGIRPLLIGVDSFERAFALAQRGEVDAVITNVYFGDWVQQDYDLVKTPILLNPVTLFYATTPGRNRDVLNALDRHIALLQDEPGSLFYRTLARWMPQLKHPRLPASFKWILVVALVALGLAGAFIQLLRTRVAAATEKLRGVNQRLASSEAIRRNDFRKAPCGVIVLNADGELQEWNPTTETLTGRGGDELASLKLEELFPTPEAREGLARHFREAVAQDADSLDLAVQREGSPPIWVQISTVRTGVGRWVSFLTDVSGLKSAEKEKTTLEEQLAVARKFESVGRMARGVAHDCNNLIAVITCTAESALGDLGEENPLRTDLLEIQKAALRCRGVAAQLQAFAREQKISPVELDLRRAVEEIWTTLQRMVGKGVDMRWKPGKDLWRVRMDPVQIDQVLTNLCANARDAVNGAGWVEVGTENRSVERGDFVCLWVRDNGCGMDAETQRHIFKPNFSSKSPDRGSGQGLATVMEIVTQNGGFLNVDSQPKRGALFEVFLPRLTEIRPSVPAVQVPKGLPPGNGEKILVVEDEQLLCTFIYRVLRRLGYECQAALSPEEALALQDFEPDLLLTDVVMPGIGGEGIARELRSRLPGLRVVFMSGHGLPDATLLPNSGFLEKPFSMERLAQELREQLDTPPIN